MRTFHKSVEAIVWWDQLNAQMMRGIFPRYVVSNPELRPLALLAGYRAALKAWGGSR